VNWEMDARSRIRGCASRRDSGTAVVWLQLELNSFGMRPPARCGGPGKGLLVLIACPFFMCLLAISILYRTYPKDRDQARSEELEKRRERERDDIDVRPA
jgi:hypothetical protein